MGYNIAIDGPAGAGKSTVAKKLHRGSSSFMWIRALCTGPWLFIFFRKASAGKKKRNKRIM